MQHVMDNGRHKVDWTARAAQRRALQFAFQFLPALFAVAGMTGRAAAGALTLQDAARYRREGSRGRSFELRQRRQPDKKSIHRFFKITASQILPMEWMDRVATAPDWLRRLGSDGLRVVALPVNLAINQPEYHTGGIPG